MSMKNKKIALFDLDGTLTDPSEGITKCVQYALSRLGIEEDRKNLLKFIGPPLTESFHDFYGLDEEKCHEAVLYYRERYSEKGIFENGLYPDTCKALELFKEKGLTLLVATSKPEPFAIKICEHYGIVKYFDHICGSGLDNLYYSKADIIRNALSYVSSYDREEIIMIGDRKHDILGAREFGIQTACVRCGFADPGELEENGADYIEDTLFDIAKLINE